MINIETKRSTSLFPPTQPGGEAAGGQKRKRPRETYNATGDTRTQMKQRKDVRHPWTYHLPGAIGRLLRIIANNL